MKNRIVYFLKAVDKTLHKFSPLLIVSILGGVAFSICSIIILTTNILTALPDIVYYVIFICAAVCDFFVVWATIGFLKQHSLKHFFLLIFRKNLFLGKITDDFRYRTILFAFCSLILNIVLTTFKIVTGWYYASTWLIVLSAYYMVLIIAKFMMIQYNRKENKLDNQEEKILHEWKAYRLCGSMLLLLTVFLQGVVILIVNNEDTISSFYNQNIVITIAAYDFYCLGSSIIYMITKRKNYAPIVNAIKSISFASSLVSMLSLQTAMFATFGNSRVFQVNRYMNIATGTIVCVIIITLGVTMIVKSNKEIKKTNEIEEIG